MWGQGFVCVLRGLLEGRGLAREEVEADVEFEGFAVFQVGSVRFSLHLHM
jgi:hypothetical protein